MSKRLNTKYIDFVNENLYVKNDLFEVLSNMPKGPVSSLLLFIGNAGANDDVYPDDSTINYISISDSLAMLKYPPKNKIVKGGDTNDKFLITPQIEMRIGRAV